MTRTIHGDRVSGEVTVTDRFRLSAAVEIRDRVVTLDRPEERGPGALRIGGEKGMILRFDAERLDCRISPVDLEVAGRTQVFTVDLLPRQMRTGQVEIQMHWTIA